MMKVRRVLEYEGDESWIKETLARCYVKGVLRLGKQDNLIREVSVEVVDEVRTALMSCEKVEGA